MKHPDCPRCETQLATLTRLYRHLDDEWQRRFQEDHACPECQAWTPPRHLARDPDDDPKEETR